MPPPSSIRRAARRRIARAAGSPHADTPAQTTAQNTRDYRYGQTDTGEVRVEHRFNDDWKLEHTTMFGRSTLDHVATNPQILASNPNMLSLQAKSGKYATNGVSNQTEITGRANLLGMQHTMTAGVEFTPGAEPLRGLLRDRRGGQQHPLGRAVHGRVQLHDAVGRLEPEQPVDRQHRAERRQELPRPRGCSAWRTPRPATTLEQDPDYSGDPP